MAASRRSAKGETATASDVIALLRCFQAMRDADADYCHQLPRTATRATYCHLRSKYSACTALAPAHEGITPKMRKRTTCLIFIWQYCGMSDGVRACSRSIHCLTHFPWQETGVGVVHGVCACGGLISGRSYCPYSTLNCVRRAEGTGIASFFYLAPPRTSHATAPLFVCQ